MSLPSPPLTWAGSGAESVKASSPSPRSASTRVAPVQIAPIPWGTQPGPAVSGAPASVTASAVALGATVIALYSPGAAVMRSAPVLTSAVAACAAGASSSDERIAAARRIRSPSAHLLRFPTYRHGNATKVRGSYSYASALSTSSFAARRAGQIAARTPASAASTSRTNSVPIG